MEIQKYEGEQGLQVSSPSFEQLGRLAKSFALSRYFDDLKGDANQMVAQAFTKIITGQEFGVPPSAAIRGINIIKGKPSISAGLMSGLIKKSNKYDYRIVERSEKRCEISCFEIIGGKRESLGPNIVWDLVKAKTAGLVGKDIWKKYPDRLLFARAISEACTIYFPDLLLGNVYTPEELEDVQDVEYEEVQPESKGEVSMRMYEEPEQEAPPLSEQEKFDKLIDYINQAKGSEPEKMKKALDNAESKLDQFNGPWRRDLEHLIKEERSKLPDDLQSDEAKEAILAEAPPEFFGGEEPQIEDAPSELFDTNGNPV